LAKRFQQMISGVTDARAWANELVRRESRGPGDMQNAMRRLANRYGMPWRTFWQLRYDPPRDVVVGVYLQLKAAYEAECQRQERLLVHERQITEAKALRIENLGRSLAVVDRSDSPKPDCVAGSEDKPRRTSAG
jgi:hypothetical protein